METLTKQDDEEFIETMGRLREKLIAGEDVEILIPIGIETNHEEVRHIFHRFIDLSKTYKYNLDRDSIDYNKNNMYRFTKIKDGS